MNISTFLLLMTVLVLPAAAQSPDAPADTWVARHAAIPAAAHVDFSHLGVHTHANAILFDTGKVDIVQMQADPTRYRNVRVVGHCRFPTDRAALPPGFDSLAQDYGPLPTYGPMEGPPGWSFHPYHANGHSGVKFTVPTRFANWVAGLTPAARHRYQSLHSYSLEITWEERVGE